MMRPMMVFVMLDLFHDDVTCEEEDQPEESNHGDGVSVHSRHRERGFALSSTGRPSRTLSSTNSRYNCGRLRRSRRRRNARSGLSRRRRRVRRRVRTMVLIDSTLSVGDAVLDVWIWVLTTRLPRLPV